MTIETERLSLIGEDAVIANGTRGKGNGGDTFIKTSQLIIEGGAELQSLGFGIEAEGDVGNITIEASDFVRVGGIFTTLQTIREDGTIVNTEGPFGGIFASAIGGGTSNGGNLVINTDRLEVQDFGSINVSNFQTLDLVPPGKGAAGNLEINASSIEVNNGTITAANANGIGGELLLNTNSLKLENGASISAETTANTGTGGNINLNIDGTLQMRNNSLISGQATEGATGGNIDINSEFIVAFPNQNNDIIANARLGNGGNINITAEALFGIEERPLNDITNDINASSEFGLDGTISIFTPDINTLQTDRQLPNNPIESGQTVAQACRSTGTAVKPSGLTIKGKGGIPPQPTEPFDSDTILVDEPNNISTLQAQHPDIKPIKTSIGDIYPARGVIKTEDGKVILTTYPTDNINTRTPQISANCSILKDEEGS